MDTTGLTLRQTEMATCTGKSFDLNVPMPEDVDIQVIAHGLSQINRYCGQAAFPISVAQHSVYCHDVAVRLGYTPYATFACLMHDAHEAYCQDIHRPLKLLLGHVYEDIARAVQDAINERFGLESDDFPQVKLVDNMVGRAEAAAVMIGSEDWGWGDTEAADIEVTPWTWQQAKVAFLDRFNLCHKEEAC